MGSQEYEMKKGAVIGAKKGCCQYCFCRPIGHLDKYTAAMILSFNLPCSMPVALYGPLWLASAMALLLYAVVAIWGGRVWAAMGRCLMLGWVAQGVAIAMDISGFGSPVQGARFGFATALSATVWLVLLVYTLEMRWFKLLPGPRRALAFLAAVAVCLVVLAPGEFRPQAASPWAPVHWALGLVSYGLFGCAVLHAALLDGADRRLRLKQPVCVTPSLATLGSERHLAPKPIGMPLLQLERLTFKFVAVGFALLSATLLLGWWFANPWRWDHKTVLSLLGWGVFAALLMGRFYLGWRGRVAIRWLYAGAVLLLLAYVGSRFILEVVLQRTT
jgi:ABC-type uncharacterized transport system permease subunit